MMASVIDVAMQENSLYDVMTPANQSNNSIQNTEEIINHRKIEIATSVSFVSGIIMVRYWHTCHFRVVMSVTISAYKLFGSSLLPVVWGVLMFYLLYLCLLTNSGVQHILCCVLVFLVFVLCILCCQFLWIFRLSLRCSQTFLIQCHNRNILCEFYAHVLKLKEWSVRLRYFEFTWFLFYNVCHVILWVEI